jgi:hypothetical protein
MTLDLGPAGTTGVTSLGTGIIRRHILFVKFDLSWDDIHGTGELVTGTRVWGGRD